MERINKKGIAPEDFFTGIAFLFIFGLLSIIGTLIGIQLITNIQLQFPTDIAIQEVGNKFISTYSLFDGITVFIMILIIVGIGVSSYRLATSRVFFVVTFIMAGLYGLVAYFFSFIFGQIIGETSLLTVTYLFPMTLLICTNLHWVGLAMVIVGSITLYAKREQGQYMT